ncbi:MAG TPA: hypothetical protein PKC20_19265 [Burkholderiaceae bacterium]|nr:hypothetical protein [Burkholderiaceae bacterium]
MRQGASPEVAAPAATLEVYVWYEADPADDDAVRAAGGRLADAMVRGGSDPMAERPRRAQIEHCLADGDLMAGRPRLLRRPHTSLRDGAPRAPWMEVWPGVPRHALQGWIARLEASALDEGALALARGGRHVEPFEAQAGARVR